MLEKVDAPGAGVLPQDEDLASAQGWRVPPWLRVLLMQCGVLLAALALWQLAASMGWGVKVVVQSPESVAKALVTLATGDDLWPNYWATLKATLVGLFIAVVIGTPIGLTLGLMPSLDRAGTRIM